MPHYFPPTRGEQRWRALSYVMVAAAGFYIMWDVLINNDPSSDVVIEGFSEWSKFVWAVFMLTALPTAWASLRGKYQIEWILLPLFGSALALAVIWGVYRMFMLHDWDLVTRVAYAAGLTCLLVVRGLQLHRVVKGGPWVTSTSAG